MTKRTWLLPTLFIAILVPGILLCGLGVALVVRQGPAEAVALREQARLRLETMANRIDSEIVKLDAAALSAARSLRIDPVEHRAVEQAVRRLTANHPIIQHPFLIDLKYGFLFPFPAVIDSTEASQLDQTPIEPRVRELYREAENMEQKEGQAWSALKLYLNISMSNRTDIDQARMALAIGRCYLKLDKLPQALSYFQEANRRLGGASPPAPVLYLLALNQVAYCYRRMELVPEAIESYLAVYDEATRFDPQGRGGFTTALKSRAADFLRQHLSIVEANHTRDWPAFRFNNPADDFFPTTSLFLGVARADPLTSLTAGAAFGAGSEPLKKRAFTNLYALLSDTTDFYQRLPVERFFQLASASTGAVDLELTAAEAGFPFQVVYTVLPGGERRLFGFTPDEEFFLRTIQQRGLLSTAKGTQPILSVLDATGKPLAPDLGPSRHLLEEWPLRHAPGHWRLGLLASSADYYTETARRNGHWLTGAVLILVISLGFGLFLFIRDTRRETRLLRLQSDFFSQAAHTLKTPLSRIQLLAEKLQLGWIADETERQEGCRRIHQQVREMTAMIDVLLDCARLEGGRFMTGSAPTDLAEIVRDVLRGWRDHLESLGYVLEVQLSPACPVLPLDRDAIAVCLVNLITNAIHYSAAHKFIGIATWTEVGEVVLEVYDHGVGIDPDEQGAVFTKFYRGRRQGPTPIGGSGLGLYIVKSVVEAHGGSVTLTSAPGRGTRVSLRLAPAGADASGPGRHDRGGLNMPRLLIIEDDRELLDGLTSTFRFHGFTVLTAVQGPQGLALALNAELDLLILDVMLPGIDGFDICKRIRAHNHRLPIILLTAKAQEAERLLGFELGADDYVTKPFSIKELVARVQAVLKRTSRATGPVTCRPVGAAVVDLDRYTIDRDGRTVTCTPREIMVLRMFLDNPGCVLSRDRILDEIWGPTTHVTTRTVDNFILKLRHKIEPDPQNPRHLLTIHGAGYKYEP